MIVLLHASDFESMRVLALALARRGHTLALIADEAAAEAAALQVAIEEADGISAAMAAPHDDEGSRKLATRLLSLFVRIEAVIGLGAGAPGVAATLDAFPKKERPGAVLTWQSQDDEPGTEMGLAALGW